MSVVLQPKYCDIKRCDNMEWYSNRSNVLNLLDFLIGAELITTKDEVIEFSKHPENYTEVYVIFAHEIMGVGI